jgi:hypothetical protein
MSSLQLRFAQLRLQQECVQGTGYPGLRHPSPLGGCAVSAVHRQSVVDLFGTVGTGWLGVVTRRAPPEPSPAGGSPRFSSSPFDSPANGSPAMSKKRKRISRRRLAGQRVLAHVQSFNLETGAHKPVTAARRYIAEQALVPPALLNVRRNEHTTDRFFWGEKGLFSAQYAEENHFSSRPCGTLSIASAKRCCLRALRRWLQTTGRRWRSTSTPSSEALRNDVFTWGRRGGNAVPSAPVLWAISTAASSPREIGGLLETGRDRWHGLLRSPAVPPPLPWPGAGLGELRRLDRAQRDPAGRG